MKSFRIKQTMMNRDGETLNKYLTEIDKIPLLKGDEEKNLAIKAKGGDKEALDLLVTSNLRFVVSVAKQYQNQGISLEDLINEGNFGLIKAAQKFDDTKGHKFISYAIHWIRQSILFAMSEHGRAIRLPVNKVSDLHKIWKSVPKLEQKLGRTPTNEEISNFTKIEEDKVNIILTSSTRVVSLDTPFNSDDEDSGTLLDVISSAETKTLDQSGLEAELKDMLKNLTEREQLIIRKYYGIGEYRPYTLEEIGVMFQSPLSRERVRQIKLKALRKLRLSDISGKLKTFIKD